MRRRLTKLKTALRRVRPLLAARGLLHARRLRRNAPYYERFGIRKSVFRTLAHRDIAKPAEERPWLDRPGAAGALAADPQLQSFPEPIREGLLGWPEQGYLVLERFFEGTLIDRINAELDQLVGTGELRFHRGGRRVRDAYEKSEAVREAVGDPRLLELLSFILGREVGVWQSISFFTGSRQAAHSDAFHMTTEPLGYLVAIWVALEEIGPGSGPVLYLPGSHRLPYLLSEELELDGSSPLLVPEKGDAYAHRIERAARESGIEPVQFLAGPGDVLVWHANLLHGGAPITEPGASRRSLVVHYYGEGALRYHEASEQPSLI